MLWTILNISFLIVYIIVVIKYLPNITNISDTKKFNSQYQLTPEFTKSKYSYAVCSTFSRISYEHFYIISLERENPATIFEQVAECRFVCQCLS